jgi:hypothetical protein
MGGGPAGARVIREAVTGGVTAARAGDATAFAAAVERVSGVDPARVAVLLGWAVRALLEDTHPDGMDGEDLRAALAGSARVAAGWESDVDPTALLVVLTGALGLSDPDEQPAIAPTAVARNALLLIDFLRGPRPFGPDLDGALAELQRAETIELP